MTGIDSKRIANDQPKGVDPVVELIVGSRGGAGGLSLGKVQAVGEHAVGGAGSSSTTRDRLFLQVDQYAKLLFQSTTSLRD